MTKWLFTVVFLLPVFSTLCRAGDANAQRADAAIEKVVADGMEAARKGDWRRYADVMHPESLEEYKKMWQPLLTAAAKEGPEKQADWLPAFDKAADFKSVIALKPKEFFVSSMKGMASLRKGIPSPLNVDEKIIGTVHEGDDQAYVVVRTRWKFDGAEMTKVEVIALKRSGTEWKMMLPDVIRIMAETLTRIGQPNMQKSGPVKDRADKDK